MKSDCPRVATSSFGGHEAHQNGIREMERSHLYVVMTCWRVDVGGTELPTNENLGA